MSHNRSNDGLQRSGSTDLNRTKPERRRFLGQMAIATLLMVGCDGSEDVEPMGNGGAGAGGGAGTGPGGGSGHAGEAGTSGASGRGGSAGAGGSAGRGGSAGSAGQSQDGGIDFVIPSGAYVLAAQDSSSADKQRANEVCPGVEDDKVIGKYTNMAGKHVFLLPGTYHCKLEAHILFGANSTLEGAARQLVKLEAKDGNARLQIGDDSDRGRTGVTIRNLTLWGYWAINNYCSGLTCEHIWNLNTLDGTHRVNTGNKGAFHTAGKVGMTLTQLKYIDCVSLFASHHGFSLHLEQGAQEGGGYDDVLFEDCRALHSGTGLEINSAGKDADWSCGFDIPDTGDINKLTVRRCVAYDAYQDGFHLDGSWGGHQQNQSDIVFEDCLAYECGRRCWEAYKAGARDDIEKFMSGFYLQNNTTLRNCVSVRCPHSGFAIKHETGYIKMYDCTDFESGYSLDIEYFGSGWECEGFTSVRAEQRVLSATCPTGTFSNFRIFDAPTQVKPVRLGTLDRVDYRDCADHAAQQSAYMNDCRAVNCTMQFLCNNISALSALIETNPNCASGQVNLSNTTLAALSGAPPSIPATPAL
jgi:hypothetical protein